MSTVTSIAPAKTRGWKPGRMILLGFGLLMSIVAGLLRPVIWNREPVWPAASLAVGFTSMVLAVVLAVSVGLLVRRRNSAR